MNEEPTVAASEDEDLGDPADLAGLADIAATTVITDQDRRHPEGEIDPEERDGREPDGIGQAAEDGDGDGDDDGVEGDVLAGEEIGERRNALPRRVESWRSRSATGAIATAMALGLQQVFEPERRRPAAVAEAPSDPYDETDPVTVEYVPDDAEGTKVRVKPWLLAKDEPS